jgi:WD40 repeat protein
MGGSDQTSAVPGAGTPTDPVNGNGRVGAGTPDAAPQTTVTMTGGQGNQVGDHNTQNNVFKGNQFGDHNTQHNVFNGPVAYYDSHGWAREDLSSAVWNPAGYYEELDLPRFTGRRELIAKIHEFIAANRHGWVDIQGEAGVGKSALAAHLVAENDWFYHYTRFPDARSPENARKNLAAQLIKVYGLEESCAPRGYLPERAGSAKYLAEVLQEAAAKREREAAGRPIVLVIDTLADINSDGQGETPLGLPEAAQLPSKVFIIVTRRPGPVLYAVGDPLLPLDIHVGERHGTVPDDANTRDIREYLRSLFYGDRQDGQLARKLQNYGMAPEAFIDTLVDRCAGVWIYLRYVLDDVRKGNRAPEAVMSLPQGLPGYYLKRFQREQERDRGKWNRLLCPALATLAALRRPVTVGQLASFIGGDVDEMALDSWLDQDIRALLHKDLDDNDEYTYEVGHQSLRDVVASPAPSKTGDARNVNDTLTRDLPRALKAAHVAIARDLIQKNQPDWPNADQYVRNTLAEHAAHAGLLDQLVTDPGFLLICQPSSVLLRRRDVTAPGLRAFSAYEAALNEWTDLPEGDQRERAWRLHVWARKTGADDLAAASGKIAGRLPVVQAAMWTGTTHRVIHAHDGSVGALAVLPARDGRPLLLASGGTDGRVRLRDPDTGTSHGEMQAPRKEAKREKGSANQDDRDNELPSGHDDWVTAAATVPLPDQEVLLATGARDGTIWVWDPQTLEPVCAPLTGHPGTINAITAVRWADDWTVLATGAKDDMVRFWDPIGGISVADPLATHRGEVTAAATVPAQDGELLATGSGDGSVQLWNPRSREPEGRLLTGHAGPVKAIVAVTVADDRTVLATGGKDGMRIYFWNPGQKRLTGSPLTAHASPVNAIAVARLAHRTLLVTAGQDHKIRLWDVDTRADVAFPVQARWVNAVATVALPDGRLLIATGGSDGKIELQELYESADGTLAATVPSSGHLGAVSTLAVAKLAGQQVLVSGSRDRTVRLWEPDKGKPARQSPLAGHKSPVTAVAATPLTSGLAPIATSGQDGTVSLWDDPLASEPSARVLKRYGPVYAMAAVELADRTLLATGGGDGRVRLWEPGTGELVGPGLDGHVGAVNAITAARLADGTTLLVSGGSDGSVRFWDPVTGLLVRDPMIGYGRIRAVATVRLPEGNTLVAAGGDYGVVQVWDGTGQPAVIEPAAGQAAAINAIAAVELPGRILLATGDDNGAVRLWDARTGAPATDGLTSRLTGHNGPVKAIVAMSLPNGQTLLATGGDDKTILIWAFAG